MKQFNISALIFFFLVWQIECASAHPFFISSNPEPFQSIDNSPTQVQVFFSEPIVLEYSDISVIDAAGNRVDNSDTSTVAGDPSSIMATLRPNLPSGIYTVTTRVLSAVDGHVVSNSYIFSVGQPIAADVIETTSAGEVEVISFEEALSRFPGYIGQILVTGATFVSIFIFNPFKRVNQIFAIICNKKGIINANLLKIVALGAVLVMISSVVTITVQAFLANTTLSNVVSTTFGSIIFTRLLISFVLLSIAIVFLKRKLEMDTKKNVLLFSISLLMLFAYSVTSHAAASPEKWAIVLDFIHGIVASFWIGGIIFLSFVVVPILINGEKVKSEILSILIPRFSSIAIASLGLIIVTGPLLLWLLEDDMDITLQSTYGKILIVKLILASAMIIIGGYHQLIIQKNQLKVMGKEITRSKDIGKRFIPLFKMEAIIGIGLLFMVSLMGNMTLPSGEIDTVDASIDENTEPNTKYDEQTFRQIAYSDIGSIALNINPLGLGQNNFLVEFFDSEGRLTEISNATVKITNPTDGIGPISLPVEKTTDGVFKASGAFSLLSKWSVEVQGISSQQNKSNLVHVFEVNLKPLLKDIETTIEQFETPIQSMPLFPLYDPIRQSIWVGDSLPGSGRIWEFDIYENNFTQHKIVNTTLITFTDIDSEGKLWYVDPLSQRFGVYHPDTNSTAQYVIPIKGTISSMTIDPSDNIWLSVTQANEIVKFNPEDETFNRYNIPSENSNPSGLASDKYGNIWFTESIGKIGKIDVSTENVTEITPRGIELEEPSALLIDGETGNIYISEHEGKRIVKFSPITQQFREYPVISEEGLAFGMALDKYRNLWYAEHVIDKISVIDPQMGEGISIAVPIQGSFIQYLASDKEGNIWFAAQRGSALGKVTIKSNALPSIDTSEGVVENQNIIAKPNEIDLSIVLMASLILVGIVVSSLMYVKSIKDLQANIKIIEK